MWWASRSTTSVCSWTHQHCHQHSANNSVLHINDIISTGGLCSAVWLMCISPALVRSHEIIFIFKTRVLKQHSTWSATVLEALLPFLPYFCETNPVTNRQEKNFVKTWLIERAVDLMPCNLVIEPRSEKKKQRIKPTGMIALILAYFLLLSGCLRTTEIQQHIKAHSVHVDTSSEELKREHTHTHSSLYFSLCSFLGEIVLPSPLP